MNRSILFLLALATALPAHAQKPSAAVEFSNKGGYTHEVGEHKLRDCCAPYLADMQRRIKRAWLPPRTNPSKTVCCVFKVNKDGTVTDVKLDRGCGLVAADEAALNAVKNAAPFRPLPEAVGPYLILKFVFDSEVFKGGGILQIIEPDPDSIVHEK